MNSEATRELDKQVVEAVRAAIGPAAELVLLHRPYLPPTAWDYIKECLDTGWVSSAGSYVTRFEDELAKFTGARRAVAVVNGTAALHVCLHLAGVRPGDEVICPSLSFVATANAIS
ncbi:MAG: DegT/DnrJ/EryC1/StrS family aminotransferase, partial [Planctomycetota bacterium]